MDTQVCMETMTWREFQSKKDRIVILPVGSTEQHGPHLPLSTDSVIAREIAIQFAKRVGGVVAPTLCYGYKSKPLSGGGPLFPGTIDLNGKTLIDLSYDVLEELVRDGIRRIFIMNAHFENEAFLLEAVDLISRKYPDVTILESNWWDVLDDAIVDQLFDEIPFPGWALEHAAVTETSLMLHLAPQLVHLDRMLDEQGATPLPYCKYPIVSGMVPDSGVLASAKGSTAEKGKLITDTAIQAFIEMSKKEFGI